VNPSDNIASAMRSRLRALVEHPFSQGVIITLILINAALLGLETWPAAMEVAGGFISALDRMILAVFVIEISHEYLSIDWIFGVIPGVFLTLQWSLSPCCRRPARWPY
jgi:hypothetical protein